MDNIALQNYVKAEVGIIITVIIVSITMLINNIWATIPLIMIGSFSMYWIGVRVWTIYIGAIIMHSILGVAGDSGLIIVVLPVTLIEISVGLFLAYSIKKVLNRKAIKQIVFVIFGLILAYGGIYMHFDIFGNPVKYLKAQDGIETYIRNTYEGKLEIESIRYGWKMNNYHGQVRSKDDFRNTGKITYYRFGDIYDGYHYKIEEKQAQEARQMLLSMIKQKTDFQLIDINLSTSIKLPYNKYTARDIYLGEEPIFVNINLEPRKLPEQQGYENKEAFCEEAYKIVKVLEETGWPYTEIRIGFYFNDGDSFYSIVISRGIEDLNDLLEIVQIITIPSFIR